MGGHHNPQLEYIAQLLSHGKKCLVVPFEDDSDGDSDVVVEPEPTEKNSTESFDLLGDIICQICKENLNDTTLYVFNTKMHIIHSIHNKDGMPLQSHRLNYRGNTKNWHAVGDYKIKQDHTLHLVLRLRGGGKRARSGVGINNDSDDELDMMIASPPITSPTDPHAVKEALALRPGSALTWLRKP